jgi:hypothetical protein
MVDTCLNLPSADRDDLERRCGARGVCDVGNTLARTPLGPGETQAAALIVASAAREAHTGRINAYDLATLCRGLTHYGILLTLIPRPLLKEAAAIALLTRMNEGAAGGL